MLRYCVLALLCAQALGRDSMTVDPSGGGGGGPDLSGSDLQTIYCEAKDKECKGSDLETAKFAPTPRQCQIRCSYNLNCLSAFYDADKNCHLRGKRCTLGQLSSAAGGFDFYRLKKEEECPEDRPQFVASKIAYSNTFCMMKDKACSGFDLYAKPQNIYPLEKCLEKCAKISSCAMVDFKDKKCSPKAYACTDDELSGSSGTINSLRLRADEDACPSSRALECGENSHAKGTACVCNDGWEAKGGKCVKSEFVSGGGETGTGGSGETNTGSGSGGKYSLTGSSLSDVCMDRDAHDYCEIAGDCISAEHIIRNIPAGLDACQRACDKECSCKAIRHHLGINCFLISTPCSTMDNTLWGWKFYIKAAKGQNCEDAKYGCRKQEFEYCDRPGDCLGHNIRHVPTGHDNCKQLCDNECACKAFFHDGWLGCWLKSIACTKRSHAVTLFNYHIKMAKGEDCEWAIEGRCREQRFKYCVRYGDCYGHNIRHEPLGLDDCKKACDRECACKAFFHDRFLGCWLKSIACTTLSHSIALYDYHVKIGKDDTCPNEFGREVSGGYE